MLGPKDSHERVSRSPPVRDGGPHEVVRRECSVNQRLGCGPVVAVDRNEPTASANEAGHEPAHSRRAFSARAISTHRGGQSLICTSCVHLPSNGSRRTSSVGLAERWTIVGDVEISSRRPQSSERGRGCPTSRAYRRLIQSHPGHLVRLSQPVPHQTALELQVRLRAKLVAALYDAPHGSSLAVFDEFRGMISWPRGLQLDCQELMRRVGPEALSALLNPRDWWALVARKTCRDLTPL